MGIHRWFAVFTTLALSDVHWGVMQATAWIEMAADAAAAESPVWETICSSVTGEKKCSRCCQLEEGRQDESERALIWEAKTFGHLSSAGRVLLSPNRRHCGRRLLRERAESRSDQPASPPPRTIGVA